MSRKVFEFDPDYSWLLIVIYGGWLSFCMLIRPSPFWIVAALLVPVFYEFSERTFGSGFKGDKP